MARRPEGTLSDHPHCGDSQDRDVVETVTVLKDLQPSHISLAVMHLKSRRRVAH
jgi:hypothetical protein